MSFEVKFFLIVTTIVVLFVLPILVGGVTGICVHSKGIKVSSGGTILFMVLCLTYYFIYFMNIGKIIPEDMKVTGHQEMVCEIRTGYR
ncbi:hypothetical protein Arno162_10 [Pectobacterium phage Arno162]|uniref:Transmembrane protein n=1 Tax=Pectobacterium phage Arno162 TaxID=2500577 RepID=A0A678ZRZ5_9CAUD|nr:hypothetical protein Arno162_10 [Pectobacterium phage Arno162]